MAETMIGFTVDKQDPFLNWNSFLLMNGHKEEDYEFMTFISFIRRHNNNYDKAW